MIPLRSLLIALLLSIPALSFAQDTVFVTGSGKPCAKTEAKYYHIIWPQPGGKYKVEYRHMEGTLKMRGTYLSGRLQDPTQREGYFVYWDKEGKITAEGNYEKGRNTGVWKHYHNNGIIKRQVTYDKNGTSDARSYDTTGKEISYTAQTFTFVEEMPQPSFDMAQYLNENLSYPDSARKNNIQGRVIIKFVVNEDGSISGAHVLRGIGGRCDEAALSVIANMPRWMPGKQNNEPVKVYFVQPVTFKLTDK